MPINFRFPQRRGTFSVPSLRLRYFFLPSLAHYANNDDLYAELIAPRDNEEEGWEPFTNLTIKQHSLPTFYAYVDNCDYNERAHEFLIRNEIAEPTSLFPVMIRYQILPFQP